LASGEGFAGNALNEIAKALQEQYGFKSVEWEDE
jgi:hypothetical protein